MLSHWRLRMRRVEICVGVHLLSLANEEPDERELHRLGGRS